VRSRSDLGCAQCAYHLRALGTSVLLIMMEDPSSQGLIRVRAVPHADHACHGYVGWRLQESINASIPTSTYHHISVTDLSPNDLLLVLGTKFAIYAVVRSGKVPSKCVQETAALM